MLPRKMEGNDVDFHMLHSFVLASQGLYNRGFAYHTCQGMMFSSGIQNLSFQ